MKIRARFKAIPITNAAILKGLGNREIDIGYKYLIEEIMPLNHDRYKTYFNQFLVINSGLLIAIVAEVIPTESIRGFTIWACILGILSCLVWLLLLCRVTVEIWQVWITIKDYERTRHKQVIKLSSLKEPDFFIFKWLGRIPGTVSLNVVPILFIGFYFLIIVFTNNDALLRIELWLKTCLR